MRNIEANYFWEKTLIKHLQDTHFLLIVGPHSVAFIGQVFCVLYLHL